MRRAKKIMMWACCTAPAVAAMVMTGVGTASATPLAATNYQPNPSYQGSGGHQGSGGYQPSCSRWQLEKWNLNGANTVTLTYNGGSYSYAVTFKQKGSCLTGMLTDTHASPTLYLPITGSVNGNHVTFSVTYPTTYQGTRTFTGRIGRHGGVSGLWSETGTENGSGPWSLTYKADPACPPYYHWWGGPRECRVR